MAAILQWAHQGIPIFDYNYVKAWGESVMVEGARFSPTTDTLAAAALVFCQGEYDGHFDCHSMETQNEHEVAVVFGGMRYPTSPAVLCASMSEAIELVRGRDKLEATSMAACEPGKSIMEECGTILRNATRQALSSRYMTMEGLWMLRDPCLIALFLDKWGCNQDSQERSLVVRLRYSKKAAV
jgi:hypothetical protein